MINLVLSKKMELLKMSGIVRAKNSFNAIVPAKWYAGGGRIFV